MDTDWWWYMDTEFRAVADKQKWQMGDDDGAAAA